MDSEVALRAAVEATDARALHALLAKCGGRPFRPLRKWAFGDDAAALEPLVAKALENGSDRQRIEVARSALAGTRLAESIDVLLVAVAVAGDRFRAFLHRSVFPDLLDRGVAYEALYGAVVLSDAAARAEHVARVREALAAKDDERLEELAAGTRWEPPQGYELVKARLGTGKTSRVALVRRAEDRTLFAWKIPSDDSEEVREDARRIVDRSREWVRLGVSAAPVDWAPDGRTLLQPFVAGETLGKLIRETDVLTDAADERNVALVAFFRRLVEHRVHLSGMNPDNLIWGGSAWQVIDSGSVRPQATPAAAWLRAKKAAAKNWTRGGMATHREAVEWFLEHAEATFGFSRLALLRERFRPRR